MFLVKKIFNALNVWVLNVVNNNNELFGNLTKWLNASIFYLNRYHSSIIWFNEGKYLELRELQKNVINLGSRM